MSTKTCPSCSADVPDAALRCKHCFHDFTEAPPKKSGLVGFVGFIAAMLVVGALTLAYVFHFNASEHIVVDAETQSIIITRKSATNTDTERVSFDRVGTIEHVMGGEKATFEVVAVTTDGGRYTIKRSDEAPLLGHAEHIAAIIKKPMVEVKNIKGFGD